MATRKEAIEQAKKLMDIKRTTKRHRPPVFFTKLDLRGTDDCKVSLPTIHLKPDAGNAA